MRIDLQHMDAKGLALSLSDQSSVTSGEKRGLVVRDATGLTGALEQAGGTLKLSDVSAQRVVLDVFALAFGTVQLAEQGEATLENVQLGFVQEAEQTALEMHAGVVLATHLAIDVGGTHLHGALHLRGVKLHTQDSEGAIEATHAVFYGLRFDSGDTQVDVPELSADNLRIGWGAQGLSVSATSISSQQCQLQQGATRCVAGALLIDRLAFGSSRMSLKKASLAALALELGFAATEPNDAQNAPRSARRLPFDLRLLDALSGQVDVDVELDVSVPVIGHRRATHKLRVPLDRGTLDYRKLENDMALLENSILDFAVREGALVLEAGIPLLRTRGHGKPLVAWELSSEDLTLAEQRRVRVAVLPQYQLCKTDESEPGRDGQETSGDAAFALRRLGLHNLDVGLTLAPSRALDGALQALSFDRLSLAGAVRHTPEGATEPGLVTGSLERLDASIVGLTVGTHILDLGQLAVAALPAFKLRFEGLAPRSLALELSELELSGLQLQQRAFSSPPINQPAATTHAAA